MGMRSLEKCNMAFESSVVHGDWRSVVIVPLYNGKRENNEYINYRRIRLLSMVGKIYAEILIGRVHRVNGGLVDDEQGGFKEGRGLSDHHVVLCTTKADR